MSSDTDRAWAFEEQLLSPATRGDAARLEQLLAPSFREIGASGRMWSRAEVIEALTAESAESTDSEDAPLLTERQAEELDGGYVLLTYRLDTGERTGWRTSLWQVTGYGTSLVFHQGTVIP